MIGIPTKKNGLIIEHTFGYLSGNSTSERSETATAHTTNRFHQLKKTILLK
jgi:hypothetical protein